MGTWTFIFGDSVLDMHGLAFVNPRAVTVATPKRLRRTLPSWVRALPAKGYAPVLFEGIPTQKVADAILWCRGLVMDERLVQGTEDAFAKELIAEQILRSRTEDGSSPPSLHKRACDQLGG